MDKAPAGLLGAGEEASEHSSNLMISGMGKFYVQIGSAIANQRGIQPITVVGREDENLAFSFADAVQGVQEA